MAVTPIPPGCNSVNAYMILKDAKAAIDFYCRAFGGQKGHCMFTPDGNIMHGEVKIGNSTVMVSQENPQWDMKSAETMGGSPVSLHIYVEDCDAAFQRAIDAGCQELFPVDTMFWGDRYGKVLDPYGYQWGIATRIEELSDEEMTRRGDAWFAEMAAHAEQGTGNPE